MLIKFLFQVILTALLSYVVEQFLPWWTIGGCAGLVAMGFSLNKRTAFGGGFAAISLLWTLAAISIDVQTSAVLSTKLAPLLGFQRTSLLILLTGLVGGIVGGLGALSGHQLRVYMLQKDPDRLMRRY